MNVGLIISLMICGFVLTFIIVGGIYSYSNEKKDWNNGHCSKCHNKWKSFDMDLQGGRGYKCLCGRYIWISYHSIDK